VFKLRDLFIFTCVLILLSIACTEESTGPPAVDDSRATCEALSRTLDVSATYSLDVADAYGNLVFATLGPETLELYIGFRSHHTETAHLGPQNCVASQEVRTLFLSSASMVGDEAETKEILSLDPNEKVLNTTVALAVLTPDGYKVSYVRDEPRMQCFLRYFNDFLTECGATVEIQASEATVLHVSNPQGND
jgi:hypothetical protein